MIFFYSIYIFVFRGKEEISNLTSTWKSHLQVRNESQKEIKDIDKECKSLNDVFNELNCRFEEIEEETENLEVW